VKVSERCIFNSKTEFFSTRQSVSYADVLNLSFFSSLFPSNTYHSSIVFFILLSEFFYSENLIAFFWDVRAKCYPEYPTFTASATNFVSSLAPESKICAVPRRKFHVWVSSEKSLENAALSPVDEK
jgi:hypothetical protein